MATYDDGSNWSAAGALMAGFSYRIDRGHQAPVSIKDSAPSPRRSRAGCTSMSAIASSTWATSETGHLVDVTFATPGPRLDDVTAHEIRVGLRWDIR